MSATAKSTERLRLIAGLTGDWDAVEHSDV